MAGFLDTAIRSIGADPGTDACEECGHPWRPGVDHAVAAIRSAADRFANVLDDADPYARRAPLAWSPAEYTWHVADVCRAWAERAVALRLEPDRPLAGFDQDELAAARNYGAMSAAAGLWALDTSARELIAEAGNAGADLSFDHPDWGQGTLGDGLRWVAHEVLHHEADLIRIVG